MKSSSNTIIKTGESQNSDNAKSWMPEQIDLSLVQPVRGESAQGSESEDQEALSDQASSPAQTGVASGGRQNVVPSLGLHSSAKQLISSSQVQGRLSAWQPRDFPRDILTKRSVSDTEELSNGGAPGISNRVDDNSSPEGNEYGAPVNYRETSLRTQEANQQAIDLIDQAKQQAEQILADAQSQVEQVRQQAYDEGFEHGKVDGLIEGKAQGEAEIRAAAVSILDTVSKVYESTLVWREQVLSRSEADIVNIMHGIAGKLFGEGVKLDANAIQQMTTRSIAEASRLGNLRIFLHPEDQAKLVSLWQDTDMVLNGQRIQLVSNPNILRGGCFIEGEFGSVDNRVEVQLESVQQALSETLVNRQAEEEV